MKFDPFVNKLFYSTQSFLPKRKKKKEKKKKKNAPTHLFFDNSAEDEL